MNIIYFSLLRTFSIGQHSNESGVQDFIWRMNTFCLWGGFLCFHFVNNELRFIYYFPLVGYFLLNGCLIFCSLRPVTVNKEFITKLFFRNRGLKADLSQQNPEMVSFSVFYFPLFPFPLQPKRSNKSKLSPQSQLRRENLYNSISESFALLHAGRSVHAVRRSIETSILAKYLNVWLHSFPLRPIPKSRFCSE